MASHNLTARKVWLSGPTPTQGLTLCKAPGWPMGLLQLPGQEWEAAGPCQLPGAASSLPLLSLSHLLSVCLSSLASLGQGTKATKNWSWKGHPLCDHRQSLHFSELLLLHL